MQADNSKASGPTDEAEANTHVIVSSCNSYTQSAAAAAAAAAATAAQRSVVVIMQERPRAALYAPIPPQCNRSSNSSNSNMQREPGTAATAAAATAAAATAAAATATPTCAGLAFGVAAPINKKRVPKYTCRMPEAATATAAAEAATAAEDAATAAAANEGFMQHSCCCSKEHDIQETKYRSLRSKSNSST